MYFTKNKEGARGPPLDPLLVIGLQNSRISCECAPSLNEMFGANVKRAWGSRDARRLARRTFRWAI